MDKAKRCREEDVKIPANDMDIDEDKLNDIDDMGNDDGLLLNDILSNDEIQINHSGDYQHENQQNMFGANQYDNDDDHPNLNNGDKESLNNNMKMDQAT